MSSSVRLAGRFSGRACLVDGVAIVPAAATPHRPVRVQRVARGKTDKATVLQARIHPPIAHDWLPVAGRANVHRPPHFARQAIPTDNSSIPSAGPDPPIGNGWRSQATFALGYRGVVPCP